MTISASIAHTATDALNAKLSALSAGYHPVEFNQDAYGLALYLIAADLARSKTAKKDQNETKPKTESLSSQSINDPTSKPPKSTKEEESKFSFELNTLSLPTKSVVRRQCPLVNAGYAARIAIVTCAVEQFITFHAIRNKSKNKTKTNSERKSKRSCSEFKENGHLNHEMTGDLNSKNSINVILLGGGLDALGIWASSISESYRNDHTKDFSIHVYDLDCEEICCMKRKSYHRAGIWKPIEHCAHKNTSFESNQTKGNPFYEKGFVDLTFLHQMNTAEHKDADKGIGSDVNRTQKDFYSFLSVDLTQVSSVDAALNNRAGINWKIPTIVISELVLAYLGRDASNQVVRNILSSLKDTPNSEFIAYEPLGFMPDHQASRTKDYGTEFNLRFREKLNRGLHTKNTVNQIKQGSAHVSATFEPLGFNCDDVQKRFEACGNGLFQQAISIPASKAVSISNCNRCMKICPEIFDEHAALAMHLRCYTLMISFSSSCLYDDGNTRSMIPQGWLQMKRLRGKNPNIEEVSKTCKDVPMQMKHNSIDIKLLSNCLRNYDAQIRELFQNTYNSYFNEFPSIKKMVKSALKTDLNCEYTLDNKIATSSMNEDVSAIGARYRNFGGEFWVGVTNNDDSTVIEQSQSTHQNQDSVKLVACLGVRPCDQFKTEGELGYSTNGMTFEIQRLTVESSLRGHGIGRQLLEQAETFCKETQGKSDKNKLHILASTPSILVPANKFYLSNGFSLIEETTIGKLTLCTYSKRLT